MNVSRRRKLVLSKLGEVSSRMERILAGASVELADLALPEEAEAGETPLERLRRFSAILQATLERIDAGEPSRCPRCGRELPGALLDELPWAESCLRCAAGTA